MMCWAGRRRRSLLFECLFFVSGVWGWMGLVGASGLFLSFWIVVFFLVSPFFSFCLPWARLRSI